MSLNEVVNILFKAKATGFDSVRKSMSSFREVGTSMNRVVTITDAINDSQRRMLGTVGTGSKKMMNFNDIVNQTAINLGKAAKKQSKFKMEWLSFLFMGMQLQRTFGGLLRGVLDTMGVMEMFNNTVLVVMLPLIEPIANTLYDIMSSFMDLPESTQKVIGLFIIFAAVLGTIMFWGAQFALFWWGLIKMFPALGPAITKAGGVLSWLGEILAGISATVLIVAAILIALFIGIYDAWKKNIGGMKNLVSSLWEHIKQIFGGVFTFLKGIFQIIFGLFSGDVDMFVEGLKNVFIGLWTFIKGVFGGIRDLIHIVIIGAINVLWNVLRTLLNSILKGYNWIADKLGIKQTGFEFPALPSYQKGGIIPSTGAYMLHKGETVIPANESSQITQNITINANVGSSYDVRRLGEELMKVMRLEMERTSNARRI